MTVDHKHEVQSGPAVLVEVTRGPVVESVHHGALAVADSAGNLLAWAGDPDTVAFYRSASKPIQAVPLVESGAADHFGFTDEELAVACGSHNGESIHTETVTRMLKKIGLGPDALACGVHMPYDKQTARDLQQSGVAPTALHNNCSGKHTGMLALARFMGWPPGGYELPDHPVQKAMLRVVRDFAGLEPDQIAFAVDGCSVSTFALSVRSMAVSFARLGDPDFWPEPRRSAVRRIAAAMAAHPEMVGGSFGRYDTDMMRAAGGMVIGKVGAEGVYCASRLAGAEGPSLGLGLKLLDGDMAQRARDVAVIEAMREAEFLSEDMLEKLEGYWRSEVHNRVGDVVGMVRPAFTLSLAGTRG